MIELMQTIVNGSNLVAIYLIGAIGLSLLFGVLGVLNFAQGDFMSLAAYLGITVVGLGLGTITSLIVLIPAMAIAGIIFYFALLRPTESKAPEMRLLATFGASFFLQGLIRFIWGPNPAAVPTASGALRVGGVVMTYELLTNVALAVTAAILLAVFLNLTPIGREVRATAQDRVGAELLGIHTRRAQLVATAVAIGLTSIGGVMLFSSGPVTATSGFHYLLVAFAVVILGGAGSILGTVLASLVLGMATSFISTYVDSGLSSAVAFVIILVVLIARPVGLAGRAA